jgi:hypothetical protein
MTNIRAIEIDCAFDRSEDEFGEHKSTEFLASITAERMGVQYEDVIEALHIAAKLAEQAKE